MPSDTQRDGEGYVLRLDELEYPMGTRRSHPLQYVTPVAGRVTWGKTARERETACEFSFQHIHLGWARQDAVSLKSLFACDPLLTELFPLLFDAETERLTFGTSGDSFAPGDLLLLDEISVHADHQGRGLGGALVAELLAQFPRQWAVLLVRTLPDRNAEAAGGDPSIQLRAATGESPKRKPRGYWARFGFRPIGGGDVMARDVRGGDDGPPPSLH